MISASKLHFMSLCELHFMSDVLVLSLQRIPSRPGKLRRNQTPNQRLTRPSQRPEGSSQSSRERSQRLVIRSPRILELETEEGRIGDRSALNQKPERSNRDALKATIRRR